MKVQQLALDQNYHNSFAIRRDTYPKYANSWHSHEEYELIYIFKGEGNLFIGDKIIDIKPNICVLIGPNLPHYWMFANNDHEDLSIDCIVVHFRYGFAGEHFFNIPELKEIRFLLEESAKGLMTESDELGLDFNSLLVSKNSKKITQFLELLDLIGSKNKKRLVSENYALLHPENDEKRMNNVMNYIKDNYRNKIDLDTLAEKAKMSKNSFCRYFKQKTSKTPIQFISELRISYACNLLRNSNLSLKEICFDSGFNNFVSFHKTFKNQLNSSPIQFRRNSSAKISI